MKTWYQSWFDSSFYHILYKDRNHSEARDFLDHLIRFLHPAPDARMLDQACGKGRHARYLNSLGFHVTGIDLSQQSIKHCKRFENDTLEFFVQDMRRVSRINYFDYVLNLFTSFGYFETDHQQQQVVQASAYSLKKGGKFIIDFMNVEKVLVDLVPQAEVEKEGIRFHIRKKVEDGFIVKTISFSNEGKSYEFQERVEVIRLADLNRYMHTAGLKINHQFGNYNLEPFDEQLSDRLILIAEKI